MTHFHTRFLETGGVLVEHDDKTHAFSNQADWEVWVDGLLQGQSGQDKMSQAEFDAIAEAGNEDFSAEQVSLGESFYEIAKRAHLIRQVPAPKEDQPDNDGWIEWKGACSDGYCGPVPEDTVVQIKQRNADFARGCAGAIGSWEHSDKHPEIDIISYRIVKD